MSWYVFALVDAPPHGPLGRGLKGALRARAAAGAFALVERRADVPPPELGSLRRHQAVVSRIANAVPAILPVRFGTLLDDDALDEALADREADIAEAFALVRHHVQFTWRGGAKPEVRHRSSDPRIPTGLRPAMIGATQPGLQYMRQLARRARGTPPSAFRPVREKLGRLVAMEKFEAAAMSRGDSLYQLVDRDGVARYERIARRLASEMPGLRLSGPFPPFAFAPDVL
jgi:Gas vesicle synthesis protein GvpL/GvpF